MIIKKLINTYYLLMLSNFKMFIAKNIGQLQYDPLAFEGVH